jgi:hypothetical protein
VPPQTAQVALLVLGGVGALTIRTSWRHGVAWVRAARTCRRSSAAPGGMVVVDDPVPQACAVPGRFGDRGRVLVTTGILRALGADERQVMLAHERAHLRERHHLYRTGAAIASAMNPLLAALPRAVEYTTERWADEQAAEDVGDRRLAARAIARAALATTRYTQQADAARLQFGHGDVPSRISKLLTAPPRRHPFTAAVLIVAVVACLAAANEAGADTESLLDQARSHPAARMTVASWGRGQTEGGAAQGLAPTRTEGPRGTPGGGAAGSRTSMPYVWILR